MIDWLRGKSLPAVDLAHVDLSGGEERPEQHGGRFGGGQHGLCLDAPLELLVQAFNSIRGPGALPLARRQAGEGKEAVAGLFQAVGDGTMAQPRINALRRSSTSTAPRG